MNADSPTTVQGKALASNSPDFALRRVLELLLADQEVTGRPEWEIIGSHVLALAERDALDWRRHASEFIGAYAAEAIDLIRTHPKDVANAASPWGLVVKKGRLAGRFAAGLESAVGLTARDDVNHRLRLASVPRVVSLDALGELAR